MLNPIITKQFTKATVRKKKTDLTDAWIIAKCVLQGEGTAVTPEHFAPAKTIDRTRYKLYELYSAVHRIDKRFSDNLPQETAVRSEILEIKSGIKKLMILLR